MNHHALQIVCAAPCQFKILLAVLAPGTVCVWEHLELQREGHFSVYLRGGTGELLEALDGVNTLLQS